MQESFVLFSSFTVKVLVWQEFKLILLLTVCSKQIDEKGSQAASLYHRIISATMVIVQTCDHFLPRGDARAYHESNCRDEDMQISHSLTRVDGHRVEASPNSRVRRSIVSEEAHARRSSVWSNSYEHVYRSLSFLCGQFSTARLEVLPNLRHAGVFQMSTMVNFGIGLTRRWAFALGLRKITGDIQIPACWKVIWKWENIMSCYS